MTQPPLVVDLDGTLLRSDLLIESALAFVRAQPMRAPMLLWWLASGKAGLKEKLARSVILDVPNLPYDREALEFVSRERAGGRYIVLATASHRIYAEQVAAHLGLFDRVLATEQGVNLSSHAKRDRLVAEYGEGGFDYAGNSRDDLAVWSSARRGYLVNADSRVRRGASKLANVEPIDHVRDSPLAGLLRAMRLHQWAKNLLIFVPLVAGHRLGQSGWLADGAAAFISFGLCASSVYLLNDLLDLEDDRRHPSKRRRPFASGELPLATGMLAIPLLLLAGFAVAAMLPWRFAAVLATYYFLTLAYSLFLKRKIAVDVIVLAILYTLRVIAGAYAIAAALTFWLLAFCMFMFLSLALVKRAAELYEARATGKTGPAPGRGYYPDDLEIVSAMGTSSGYLAVMVLALYIQDQSTVALYRHPHVIWLACPLLLYWISRAWLITHRGGMHDDPVVFAVKDRVSLLTGVLFGAVFWFAL